MSDESSHARSSKAESGSGIVRKIVLFSILGLGLCAMAYDRLVARPAVQEAYDKITSKSVEVNSKSTEVLTNTGVSELLGKQPAESFLDENGDTVEVYQWRAGLPIRTHDLFAVFKTVDGQLVFYRHAMGKYEKGTDVSQHDGTELLVVEAGDGSGDNLMDSMQDAQAGERTERPEDLENAEDRENAGDAEAGHSHDQGEEGESSAGGSGSRGPGSRGPGRGGFDAEAMFNERDADGDGQLSGDEISDRMRENLDSVDTDGDGSVSLEELMDRVDAMQAQRANSGGQNRGSRPEVEDEEAESPEAESPEADSPAADSSESETPESDDTKSE